MNWILLFVAFLATTTLAAPTSPTTSGTTEVFPMVPQSDSPTSPQDASSTILVDNSLTVAPESTNNSPTVPKDFVLSDFTEVPRGHISKFDKAKALVKSSVKAIKEFVGLRQERNFLDNLTGLNQELQLDDRIISILSDHAVSETVARQAVEEARKNHWARDDSHKKHLQQALFWILRGREALVGKVYLEALQKIGVGHESDVYNDDRMMDLVFAMMLIGETSAKGRHFIDPVQFEIEMRNHLLTDPRWSYLASCPDNQEYLDGLLSLKLGEMYEASRVWKTLQEARQMIKSSGVSNNDGEMVRCLVKKLSATANLDEIRETMKKTRHAITLRNAVMFSKAHSLRELVASGISCPVYIFGEIVLHAASSDIFRILRLRPSFQADVVSKLMDKVVQNEDRLPIVKLLLEDPRLTQELLLEDPLLTHATLVDGLVKAKRTSIQAIIFKKIFQHAERAEILKVLGKVESVAAIKFTKLYDRVMNDATCSLNPRLKNLRGDPSIQDFEHAVNAVKVVLITTNPRKYDVYVEEEPDNAE